MQAFAQRHCLSPTLSRQGAQKIVAVPARPFASFGMTNEIQRRRVLHRVTLALAVVSFQVLQALFWFPSPGGQSVRISATMQA